MVTSPDSALVRSGKTIVRTLGTLNIIFGVLLVCAGLCVSLYLVVIPGLMPMMQKQADALQKAEAESLDRRIEDLRKQEAEAKTAEEKQNIRDQRLGLESRVEQGVYLGQTFTYEDLALDKPVVIAHYATDVISAFILNGLMIIGGIGLLRSREWARKLCLGVAGIKIVRMILLTISLFAVVIPLTSQAFSQFTQRLETSEAEGEASESAPAQDQEDVEQTMKIVSGSSGIGFLVLGSIYPAVMVYLLSRPSARAACQASKPAGRLASDTDFAPGAGTGG